MTTYLPGVPDVTQTGVLDFDGIHVPVVEMNWLDERTGCAPAHRYLAGELQGVPSDYAGCFFYCSGRCNMNGRGANPCLFHEAETSASWARVRGWRLLEYPDGSTCVTLAHCAAEIAAEIGARVIGAAVVVR